jgi:Flp pilus assembly pilin Flp
MSVFRELWSDETGVILSAEAVVLGTLGIVGLTAGLSTVSSAVNSELQDLAFAIRSLDQSYEIPAQSSCGAYTAGSSFKQDPVEESLAILCDIARKANQEANEEASKTERLEKQMQKRKAAERRKKAESKKRTEKGNDA